MTAQLYHKGLTACRRIYTRTLYRHYNPLHYERDADVAGRHIFDLLQSGRPCMIARFGANELTTVFNYLGITEHRGEAWGYITRRTGPWWWNKQIVWQLQHGAGFFPTDNDHLSRFCRLMLEDTPQVDILGSWLKEEACVEHLLAGARRVALPWLEPWFASQPWSRALEGRKLLVVHPFSELIEQQYERREQLFSRADMLPRLASLQCVKAVQSYGSDSGSCGYADWFEALASMERQMDAADYDVCILGCGAYGFPLAAHAKRQGRQAIHLGGVSQLLFGITGSRWMDPMHGVQRWGLPRNFYNDLMTKAWVRPGESTKPSNAEQVEGACYW